MGGEPGRARRRPAADAGPPPAPPLTRARRRAQGYVAEAEAGSLPTVAVAHDVYAALQATAAAQGKSATHLATEALRHYLA